jgi:hypothetical protein
LVATSIAIDLTAAPIESRRLRPLYQVAQGGWLPPAIGRSLIAARQPSKNDKEMTGLAFNGHRPDGRASQPPPHRDGAGSMPITPRRQSTA